MVSGFGGGNGSGIGCFCKDMNVNLIFQNFFLGIHAHEDSHCEAFLYENIVSKDSWHDSVYAGDMKQLDFMHERKG